MDEVRLGRSQGERDPRHLVVARRCATIPLVFALLGVAVATAWLWAPLAALYDASRRWRSSALGCGFLLTWYLACECAGVLASAWVWLRHRGHGQRFLAANFALQCRWADALFRGAARIFGIRMEVEGQEELARSPYILMLRHATVVDTLIPTLLASVRYAKHLRFVLKRELLWDPCLDIVGCRLPNYFARRGSSDPEREIRGVAALAADLGPDEGLLIYPEGTRFTPAKRQRILERFAAEGRGERLARARALEHVLPPRTGGVLGLLAAAPLDVVVGAHSGLDAVTSFWEIWNGALRGATLRVCFWRVPRDEIGDDPEARAQWLYEAWCRVDRWVGEQQLKELSRVG